MQAGISRLALVDDIVVDADGAHVLSFAEAQRPRTSGLSIWRGMIAAKSGAAPIRSGRGALRQSGHSQRAHCRAGC